MTGLKNGNLRAALKKLDIGQAVFIFLAVLIAFVTFYALALPAITWERSLICDKPEHVHTDECYEEVFVDEAKILICENKEADHEHTDACYEIVPAHTDKNLICKIEEHVHDDGCFDAPPSEDEGYICGMVAHTHNELCYTPDGELRCTIPEHEHTTGCKPEVKSTVKTALKAAAPLGASGGTAEQIYWVPITSTSDLSTGDVYMVATRDGGVALSGTNSTTSTKANMQAVSGKSGYYTSDLDDEYWWKVSKSGTGDGTKLYNVDSSKYLRLRDGQDVLTGNSTSDGTTITMYYYNYQGTKGWQIYKGDSTALNYDGSKFNSNYYLTYMTVYKQVIEGGATPTPTPSATPAPTPTPTNPGAIPGGGGSSDGKPDYPAYTEVSGGKHDATSVDAVEGEYWSDPATSKLESKFAGVSADDGKVLTDKSVVYGKDDYGAFSSYPDNTFGVTLSALAQEYILTKDVKIDTPIDVVFIIDCSGSMIDNKGLNGESSVGSVSVKALNKAMNEVLDANPDNRVGVACFSNCSEELLPLGRYTVNNQQKGEYKFFPENDYTDRYDQLAPTSAIRIEGTNSRPSTGSWNEYWGGTYTQSGIARGAAILLREENTTVTRTVQIPVDEDRTVDYTYTTERKPVIVLLSDGEPTFCNDQYSNVLATERTNTYGSGNSGYNDWKEDRTHPKTFGGYYETMAWVDNEYSTNNEQAVHGYYTILSANSYKDQVANHYNTDAYFYTIGVGIFKEDSADANNSWSISTSGDDYKRAVLNPSVSNVNSLLNHNSSWCYGEPPGDAMDNTFWAGIHPNYRDTSGFTNTTRKQLVALLGNNYSGSTITVESHAATNGLKAQTKTRVPIIKNPYAGDFNYADYAAIVTEVDVGTVAKELAQAKELSTSTPIYGFILRQNKPLTVSDTIGDGMEIKTEPVLNYGGVNYAPTSHETVDGKTVYHYTGTYTATDGSGQTADLSKITAEVETVNGKQIVRLVVPDEQMPTYSPHLNEKGEVDYYYEALPVRLVYQVGLTEESEQAVKDLEGSGESLTFYTNAWTYTDYSVSDFEPSSTNPYFNEDDYDRSPLDKSDNLTDTKDEAWKYTDDSDEKRVDSILGNNGKLEFSSEVATTSITLNKVNQVGNLITESEASFELYKDENLTNQVGSYRTENGVLMITGLEVGKTYYLVETEAPAGFEKLDGAIQLKVNGINNIEILSMNDMAGFADGILSVKNSSGYELPETGGIGTTILYTIGGILVVVAAVVLVTRKRMDDDK